MRKSYLSTVAQRGLLLTDAAAPRIRATRDVDVIVEVASLASYHRLSARLREYGFREDQSDDAPICLWINGDLILDLMPTKTELLGFGNDWYAPAFHTASPIKLPSGTEIRLIRAPYFLATKLAAFFTRGSGDYMLSHDFEDIVAVVDGRQELVNEVAASQETLRTHLAEHIAVFLDDPDFHATLPGHLPGDAANQERLPVILESLRSIASLRQI
ncbi:MAG: hypothetical protein RQ826_15125 [Xanthomonadales bacterium]|nr:hypothetical protein [Xanthomonadales bacterium]